MFLLFVISVFTTVEGYSNEYYDDEESIYYAGDSLIYNYNKLSILNSLFKNNVGRGFGGVIRSIDSTLTISSTTFDNYVVTTGDGISIGGVLCLKDSITNITNSKFSNNHAKHSGGAIYIYIESGKTTINKSNFNNNRARLGGAIFICESDYDADVKIYNSTFTKNNGFMEGGAIYNQAMLEIINSQFKNNTAETGNGGAIVNNEGILVIKSSNITSNKVEGYCEKNLDEPAFDYGNGGGIFQKTGVTTISNSIINHNYAYNGGAITIEWGEINLINNKINDNNASYGGTISKNTNGEQYYDDMYYNSDVFIININNCSFNNNYAEIEASVIYNGYYLGSGGNITITNSIFNNNKLSKTINYYGGNIIENCGYISIRNSNIINHKGSSSLIGSWGHLDFRNTSFKNNNVISIIDSISKATVTSCTFQLNNVTKALIENYEGQGPGLFDVTKSNFISNKGVAIYFIHSGYPNNMKIENNYWGSPNPSWSSLLHGISKPNVYSKTKF